MKFREPGQGVILREVWHNKVYSVVPVRVVHDSFNWSALYLPPHTQSLWPHTREGETIRIPVEEWILDGGAWEGGDVLYLVQPGLGYITSAVWDNNHVLDHWKIDLVEPVRRTPLGFDYMDQLLDIIVTADCSTWHWKDEDEVGEAVSRGIFTEEQARALFRRGETAVRAMQTHEPPFDRKWEIWEPDPAWRVLFELPAGWDRV